MSLLKEKLKLRIEETVFKTQKLLSRFTNAQKWLLMICLLGAAPGYFLAKTAGNIYFERQYRPLLITPQPSFGNPKSLLIERIDIGSLGENEYTVVAQVSNPNLDLAAKTVSYELKFFAADGSEAALSEKGKFFILPNQKKYIIAPKVVAAAGIARAELRIDPQIHWQKKTTLPPLKLLTTSPKGYDQLNPFGYVLEGAVTNNSAYAIKEIKVHLLLYGYGGKIIGGATRTEFSLKPFETRAYRQFWPGISGRNVLRAEASVETDVLNKENLTAPEAEGRAGSQER